MTAMTPDVSYPFKSIKLPIGILPHTRKIIAYLLSDSATLGIKDALKG